jgi:hypothetical protein
VKFILYTSRYTNYISIIYVWEKEKVQNSSREVKVKVRRNDHEKYLTPIRCNRKIAPVTQ